MQAIDQIINSAGKLYYMSGGTVHCPVTFRGPNGAAAGVAAQHSQVSYYLKSVHYRAFPGPMLERPGHGTAPNLDVVATAMPVLVALLQSEDTGVHHTSDLPLRLPSPSSRTFLPLPSVDAASLTAVLRRLVRKRSRP